MHVRELTALFVVCVRSLICPAESLRFGKSPDSEIFQIVSFTSDTVVRKTNKQNNSFELITPLMASNGHALLLFAPTPQLLSEWVDAITLTILKLAPRGSPTMRSASAAGDEQQHRPQHLGLDSLHEQN